MPIGIVELTCEVPTYVLNAVYSFLSTSNLTQ